MARRIREERKKKRNLISRENVRGIVKPSLRILSFFVTFDKGIFACATSMYLYSSE